MMSSDKFCLQWNDFKDNMQSAFRENRENLDLSDVTLVCKDGQNIEAHKIIISASSPILRDIIMLNKHPHPLIYMRGINAKNMNYIIDFMYYGEVNIFQENLDDFLNLANEFKLKGLHKTSLGDQDMKSNFFNIEQDVSHRFIDNDCSDSAGLNKGTEKNDNKFENLDQNNRTINKRKDTEIRDLVLARNDKISMENSGIEELDETIKTMMEKQINSWVCKICGKSDKNKFNVRDHIEAKHITGMEHPCTICGKTYRSRNSLKGHILQLHSKTEIEK